MSQLGQFVELLGEDATLKLVEQFGGLRITVSKKGPGKKKLVAALGETNFKRMLRFFGGGEIMVPVAKRWRAGIYLQRPELTNGERARLLGWSETTVYKLAREIKLAGPDGLPSVKPRKSRSENQLTLDFAGE